MDGEIDLKPIRREFYLRVGEFSLFYTISRFHNPLGGSYNEAYQEKIVEPGAAITSVYYRR